MKYYSVVNKTGLAKLSSAMALGLTISLSTMAIGDGAGPTNVTAPSDTKNALAREVYRAPIVSLQAEDPERPGLLTATMIVPPDKGGWTITEGIIFCDDGTPFANAALTPGYKSTLAEGGVGEYIVEFVFEIANADAATVQLVINPYLTIATRQWVTAAFATKSELTTALAALEAKMSQPPVLDSAGELPVSGDTFVNASGDYQLRLAPENSLLVITVSSAVVGLCRLIPPAGELLKTIRGDVAIANLVTVGVPYRFLRKNNLWRQL